MPARILAMFTGYGQLKHHPKQTYNTFNCLSLTLEAPVNPVGNARPVSHAVITVLSWPIYDCLLMVRDSQSDPTIPAK